MFAILLLCIGPAAPSAENSLDVRLAPLIRAHKGKVAVAVKHLGTGESFYHHADEVMPTASLIKLPVMLEAYTQAAENKIKLTDRITLRDADKVPGSGILTEHFSDGATFSLGDGVRLMIAFSDNTATNLVLNRVGIREVNKRIEAWGYPNTRINAKVFLASTTSVDPERTKKYGLGSTTAKEMIGLLEDLESGKHFRPAVKQAMLGHLKKCDDKDKFSRYLPADVILAHKTGSVSDARTDAGILYLDSGAVVMRVLTAGNEDRSWTAENAGNVLCAKVAKDVYDYFSRKR